MDIGPNGRSFMAGFFQKIFGNQNSETDKVPTQPLNQKENEDNVQKAAPGALHLQGDRLCPGDHRESQCCRAGRSCRGRLQKRTTAGLSISLFFYGFLGLFFCHTQASLSVECWIMRWLPPIGNRKQSITTVSIRRKGLPQTSFHIASIFCLLE